MSDATQEEVIEGREPSFEERLVISWAEEAYRRGPAAAIEGLRQLVALSAALLASSAALLPRVAAPAGCKGLAVLLVLAALAVSLWGSLPRESVVVINRIDLMRQERARRTKRRMRCLWWSAALFISALALVVGAALGSARV